MHRLGACLCLVGSPQRSRRRQQQRATPFAPQCVTCLLSRCRSAAVSRSCLSPRAGLRRAVQRVAFTRLRLATGGRAGTATSLRSRGSSRRCTVSGPRCLAASVAQWRSASAQCAVAVPRCLCESQRLVAAPQCLVASVRALSASCCRVTVPPPSPLPAATAAACAAGRCSAPRGAVALQAAHSARAALRGRPPAAPPRFHARRCTAGVVVALALPLALRMLRPAR